MFMILKVVVNEILLFLSIQVVVQVPDDLYYVLPVLYCWVVLGE